MACPLCKNNSTRILLHLGIEMQNLHINALEWCNYCAVGFITPFPSQEQVNSLYSDDYSCYQSTEIATLGSANRLKKIIAQWRFSSFTAGWGAKQIVARFVEVVTGKFVPFTLGIPLQLNKTSRIMEVGCGNGEWLIWMHRLGYSNLIGFDVNDKGPANVRTLGIVGESGDINKLCQYEKSDLVRLQHVLEHISDPVTFLKHIRTLLSSDGKLVIVVPNIKSVSFMFGKNYTSLMLPFHLIHYSPSGLRKVLEGSGFRVIGIKTLGQSSVFMQSLRAHLLSMGHSRIARLVCCRPLALLLSPIWGIIGVLGFGEEITVIAEPTKTMPDPTT